MGGSGSSSSFPTSGGGGTGDTGDDCDLQIQTNLFGPVQAVVSTLQVGDLVDIELVPAGATFSVAVMTRDVPPKQAGTITGIREQAELVRCLQDGVTYEAEVVQVAGANVQLQIRRT